MPEVSIDLNMVRVTNDDFVKKAEACAPKLQGDRCKASFYRGCCKNRKHISRCSCQRLH